jgi:hypothetical protein
MRGGFGWWWICDLEECGFIIYMFSNFLLGYVIGVTVGIIA